MELIQDRIEIDRERTVIASLVDHPDCYYKLPEIFAPEHFEVVAHQEIMRAIKHFQGKGQRYDWITLRDHLNKSGVLDVAGGEDYLAALMNVSAESWVVDGHASKIMDRAKQRTARQLMIRLQDMIATGTSTEQAIERTAQALLDLTAASNNSPVEHVSSVIQRYQDNIKSLIAMSDEDRLLATQGHSTGLIELDNMLNGGLKPGQMVVVAGRPGMGKSMLGMNIMRAMAKNNPDYPVIFFSMEMTKDNDLAPRLLADTLNIQLKALHAARLNDTEVSNWNKGIESIKSLNLYLDEETSTIDGMRIECRKLAARNGGKLGAIFIDYLQLMKEEGKKSRFEEVSTISREIKRLAKAMKCPVIALSQLSRKCEERGKNKRPIVSDLRESGQIEQDADIIMLLYRDDVYAKSEQRSSDAPGICEVDVAKHRNGGIGVVRTLFNGAYQRLENFDPHFYGGRDD